MNKKRKGWVRICVLILVLALLGVCFWSIYQCSAGDGEGAAYVQPVSSIVSMGSVGLYSQYNGIVEAKDVIEINPSGSIPVKDCFVKAGSEVNEGDPLFCYDVDDLELQYTQLQIDVTGVENNLQTYREQLTSLRQKLTRAEEKDRYQLELDIQTAELEIRKAEYDLADKQRKAEEMQQFIDQSEVCSPVTGTVRSVRDSSGAYDPYGYGSGSSAYITIIAGTAFCVKGTVNEQTIATLYIGMPVLIRSRVSDAVYSGTIYRIDTESPDSSQSGVIYYDSGERASKYAFYVEPESIDGLMIGQHVLIDLNTSTSDDGGLMLPSSFVFEENGGYYVWAANSRGYIEKRAVTISLYYEETDCYRIVRGLTLKDRIAFPDGTVHAGMKATETAFNDQPAGGDGSFFENGAGMMPAGDGMDGTDDDTWYQNDDDALSDVDDSEKYGG